MTSSWLELYNTVCEESQPATHACRRSGLRNHSLRRTPVGRAGLGVTFRELLVVDEANHQTQTITAWPIRWIETH